MVKKSERERASVHVMLYALLVFAFAMDRFRRPSWYSKGIRTDVFCVNKEKTKARTRGTKKGKGFTFETEGRCVLHLLHLCSSFTLCVCHFVFCIYCVCILTFFLFICRFIYLPFCFLYFKPAHSLVSGLSGLWSVVKKIKGLKI